MATILIEKDVMVPMRDGVRLATDVLSSVPSATCAGAVHS